MQNSQIHLKSTDERREGFSFSVFKSLKLFHKYFLLTGQLLTSIMLGCLHHFKLSPQLVPDTALVPASSTWPPPRVIMFQQHSPFCFRIPCFHKCYRFAEHVSQSHTLPPLVCVPSVYVNVCGRVHTQPEGHIFIPLPHQSGDAFPA